MAGSSLVDVGWWGPPLSLLPVQSFEPTGSLGPGPHAELTDTTLGGVVLNHGSVRETEGLVPKA